MAADGSIIIETLLDDKDAQKELTRLNNRIKTLNNQIYTNQRLKMPLVEQSRQVAAQLDAAKATLGKRWPKPRQKQRSTPRALPHSSNTP